MRTRRPTDEVICSSWSQGSALWLGLLSAGSGWRRAAAQSTPACSAGSFLVEATGACDLCEAGQYDADGSSATPCADCPLGLYSAAAGALECAACSSGTQSSDWVDGACFVDTQAPFEWVEPPGRTKINFTDWTSGGQNSVPHDDGWYDVSLASLGVPCFSWYGLCEDTISVGTNGLVTFGAAHLEYGSSEPVPHASAIGSGIDGLIAVFWSDINPGGDNVGGVWFGTSPTTSALILEWSQVAFYADPPRPDIRCTFELVMHPSGDLKLQYLDMPSPLAAVDVEPSLSSPSIGYEDRSGMLGQQLSYGTIPAPRTAYSVTRGCHSRQGSVGCVSCVPGFSDADADPATPCAACSPGYYSISVGSTDCDHLECGPGTEAPAGSTRCTACPAGMFDDDVVRQHNHTLIGLSDCDRVGPLELLASISFVGSAEVTGARAPPPLPLPVCNSTEITVTITIVEDGWGEEISWSLDGSEPQGYTNDHNNESHHYTLVLANTTEPHTFTYADSWGDGWHGGWWQLDDGCGQLLGGGPILGQVTGGGGVFEFGGNQEVLSSQAALDGHATVSSCGLVLDGDGDRARIPNFDYSSDGSFTIGFWITKEQCTSGPWEYVYSHNAYSGDIMNSGNPGVNLFFTCGSTDMRVAIVSDSGQRIAGDYPVHDAPSFDAVTAQWMQLVTSISPDGIAVFVDGVHTHGFGAWGFTGPLDVFADAYTGSTMATDIFIGSRVDGNSARHFLGRISGIRIASDIACAADAVQWLIEGTTELASNACGNSASTPCSACAAGRYTDQLNSVECSGLCPAGTYSAEQVATNASVCEPCQPGQADTDSSPGTACTDCAFGQYSDAAGSVACENCPSSSPMSNEAGNGCVACATGSWVETFDCSLSVLVTIGDFRWGEEVSWSIDGQEITSYTGNGQPTDGDNGQTFQYTVPLGDGTDHFFTFTDSWGDGWHGGFWGLSSPCGGWIGGGRGVAEGYVQGSGGTFEFTTAARGTDMVVRCTLCEPGRFSDVESAAECAGVCAAGTYSGEGGSSASSCVPCNAGYYDDDADAATPCSACDAGFYSASVGSTDCDDFMCGAGTVAPEGSANCTACPAGQFDHDAIFDNPPTSSEACALQRHVVLNVSFLDSTEVTGDRAPPPPPPMCNSTEITVTITIVDWGEEISWSLDGSEPQGYTNDHNDESHHYTLALANTTEPHTFTYADSWGDGWHGGWWQLDDGCGQLLGGGPILGQVTGGGGVFEFGGNQEVLSSQAALDGHATVSSCGLVLDGDGDRARIPNFDYSSDGSFTIGFWITKEQCTSGPWEYVYSHNAYSGDILSSSNPNINYYMGCAYATFMRTIIVADDENMIAYDYISPATGASTFDVITTGWLHVAMVFTNVVFSVYVDGAVVPYEQLPASWTDETNGMPNIARASNVFEAPFVGCTLGTDVFIGSRADGNAARHYHGRIANVIVATNSFCQGAVSNLFIEGEQSLFASCYITSAATACAPCAVGRFSAEAGSLNCAECPLEEGQTSSRGAAECMCVNGYAASINGTVADSGCHLCPNGTYSTEQMQTCEPCPLGRYAEEWGGLRYCAGCRPGTFGSTVGSNRCDKCSPGTELPSAGATSSSDCLLCPIGKLDADGDAATPCAACTAGYFSNETGVAASSVSAGSTRCSGECRMPKQYCPPGSDSEDDCVEYDTLCFKGKCRTFFDTDSEPLERDWQLRSGLGVAEQEISYFELDPFDLGSFHEERGSPLTAAAGLWSWHVLVADLSGNGHPDILVAGARAQVFQQDASGIVEDTGSTLHASMRGCTSSHAAAADFNDDAAPDVYITCLGRSRQNKMLLNDGSGAFTEVFVGSVVTATGIGYQSYSTTLDDFNVSFNDPCFHLHAMLSDLSTKHAVVAQGDGLVDVYATHVGVNAGGLNVYGPNQLFLGNGRGSFTEQPDNVLVTGTVYDPTIHAILQDLNGDGNPDCYTVQMAYAPNKIFLGDGAGGFELCMTCGDVMVTSTKKALQHGFSPGLVLDTDSDGDLDIYQANGAGNNQLYVNDGSGYFVEVFDDPSVTSTGAFSEAANAAGAV
eukprot:SAG22_NODE_346_length_11892_cov_40.205970_3_plen_2055_part_00